MTPLPLLSLVHETVADAIVHLLERRSADTFGFVVDATTDVEPSVLLPKLRATGDVYVSLVGHGESGLTSYAGWDEATLGFDASHAVDNRNTADGVATKVALVWKHEPRLHSLTERGYARVGTDDLAAEVARLGVERVSNRPQKNFWRALSEADMAASVGLDRMSRFFVTVGLAGGEGNRTIRDGLPEIGLFEDSEMLTSRYSEVGSITDRLVRNRSLVERFLRGEPRDRQGAASNLRAADAGDEEVLGRVHHAFVSAARTGAHAFHAIDLQDAERLLRGPRKEVSKSDLSPPNEVIEDGGNGPHLPEPPPPEGPQEFDEPGAAALEMVMGGEAEDLEELVASLEEVLNGDKVEKDVVDVGDAVVNFSPDPRAGVLARVAFTEERFGGVLRIHGPLDDGVREIGRHLGAFEALDMVDVGEIRGILRKAEALVPDFEGGALLDGYLNLREGLIANLTLLASTPLAAMLGRASLMEAVDQACSAYRRLLAHLSERYADLSKLSPEGGRKVCDAVLSLDVVVIEGEDETVALAGAASPLVLWKYLELARFIREEGPSLTEEDAGLLADELDNLPEPLTTLTAPRLVPVGPLGYSGHRIGSMPVYRESSVDTSDVSAPSIRRAAAKLVALYPPARRFLRVLVVDPVSLTHATSALRDLVAEGRVERVSLTVARTRRGRDPLAEAKVSGLDALHESGALEMEEVRVESMEELASRLAVRPAHLVVLSGERERNVDSVERERTKLHPLSIPHKLYADPLTDRVSLRPRSLRPEQNVEQHPYGLYQDLITAMSGNDRERTTFETRRVTLDTIRPLVPYCQVLVVAGVPEEEEDLDLIRLAQGSGTHGDTTFTAHGQRIFKGIDGLLREMNYDPTEEGIKKLVDRVEEMSGDGVFATVSDKGDGGFSRTALRGLLGLAVALDWYRSVASGERHLVVSTDSYLAQQWLRMRPDGKRTDLLGFREDSKGEIHVDVIEVKSYESTSDTDGGVLSSNAAAQLRSVGDLLGQMLDGRGNILMDRRREILRRQIFLESLLVKKDLDTKWVNIVNDVLDGERSASVNLFLVELALERNIEPEWKTFGKPAHGERPIQRLRMGEDVIQGHLGGIGRRAPELPEIQPVETGSSAVDERDGGGQSVEANPTAPTASDYGPPPDYAPPPISALSSSPDPALQEGPSPSGPQEDPRGDGESEAVPNLGYAPSPSEWREIEQGAKRLYKALRDLGVGVAGEVDPTEADVGPSVIRYKVRLRPGERTSAVQGRARDIMREIAAEKEPIIDVLPNTNFVYVDLPRPQRQPAYLRPLLEDPTPTTGRLVCPIGVTPGGEVVEVDIAALPHMLVAGSTGSGKTIFLYSLIVGLCARYRPEELTLILIDPKQTDFVYFDDMPHLHGQGVIVDPEEAVGTLRRLLDVELEQRTIRLKEAKARDITSYNERHPASPIPSIVVVIDEFADLADVMDGSERDEFDSSLRRLAQRARNVGIHLILATQRPTTGIVNGTIKANLPCRVSFRLASHVDSQTILGKPGAEKLLGNGDMIFDWNGDTMRLQGFFVPEGELLSLPEG